MVGEKETRRREGRPTAVANPGYAEQNYWLSGILITCRMNDAALRDNFVR